MKEEVCEFVLEGEEIFDSYVRRAVCLMLRLRLWEDRVDVDVVKRGQMAAECLDMLGNDRHCA